MIQENHRDPLYRWRPLQASLLRTQDEVPQPSQGFICLILKQLGDPRPLQWAKEMVQKFKEKSQKKHLQMVPLWPILAIVCLLNGRLAAF